MFYKNYFTSSKQSKQTSEPAKDAAAPKTSYLGIFPKFLPIFTKFNHQVYQDSKEVAKNLVQLGELSLRPGSCVTGNICKTLVKKYADFSSIYGPN